MGVGPYNLARQPSGGGLTPPLPTNCGGPLGVHQAAAEAPLHPCARANCVPISFSNTNNNLDFRVAPNSLLVMESLPFSNTWMRVFGYVASNIELHRLEQALQIFLRQGLKVMLANLKDLIANDSILCLL